MIEEDRETRRKTTIWLWDQDRHNIDAIQTLYGVRSSIEAIRLALQIVASSRTVVTSGPVIVQPSEPEAVAG